MQVIIDLNRWFLKVILMRKAIDFKTESKTKLFLDPGQQTPTELSTASRARKNLYQRCINRSLSKNIDLGRHSEFMPAYMLPFL